MARVVLENLTRIFEEPRGPGVTAVDRVNLVIEPKELLVLVGPSGCGKTTTLRMIAGLEEVSAGTISIDGQPMKGISPKDRDIAMVFQNHALYPHMTVRQNIGFGLQLRNFSKSEIQTRVNEAAQILNLTDCLDRRPNELSGGQKQRVAVGRALVRQPKVFLFDEPLSNLDPASRAQMRTEIARLHSRLGATMLYVTHDQTEAMTLGQRIAVMKAGVIEQVDPPLNLYQRPANLFVAGFIGAPPMNFFTGTLVGTATGLVFEEPTAGAVANKLAVPLGKSASAALEGYVGKRIILGLRPENVLLAAPGPPTPHSVEALVELVEQLGSETLLYSRSAAHSFVVRARSASSMLAHQRISLAFEMAYAHFFDPDTKQTIS
jgi:multiple sugar transport system ATP-binding protein